MVGKYRKCVSIDGNMLWQKVLSQWEDASEGCPKTGVSRSELWVGHADREHIYTGNCELERLLLWLLFALLIDILNSMTTQRKRYKYVKGIL